MFTDINGLKTEYVDMGKGDVIIFLHGWGCDCNVFFPMLKDLSSEYRVISVSFPGFGRSETPSTAWCVGEYAIFLKKFMEELGINGANVFAHSFGGRVVIRFAEMYGTEGYFNRIILAGAAGLKRHYKFPRNVRNFFRRYTFKLIKLVFSIPVMNKLYPHFMDNMRKHFGSADYNAAVGIMRDIFVRVVNEDLTPYVPKITNPTLLLWGTLDDATPIEFAHYFKEHISAETALVTFENCNHFAFAYEKDAFVREIKNWLKH